MMNTKTDRSPKTITPTIRTWRERIGAGPDFPLHAPTDVERAMEAEIAELRTLISLRVMQLDAQVAEIEKRSAP